MVGESREEQAGQPGAEGAAALRPHAPSGGRRRRPFKTLIVIGGLMLAASTLVYYSVPLYRLFCQVTGYGGATRRGNVGSVSAASEVITVRFDTAVAPDLPWRFKPERIKMRVRTGEPATAYFLAENLSGKPIVGHAVYNVTPFKVGKYFSKIECFCFVEERLEPGVRVRMPVTFVVDPALMADPLTREVRTITLSYTFFRSRNPGGAADLGRFGTPSSASSSATPAQAVTAPGAGS